VEFRGSDVYSICSQAFKSGVLHMNKLLKCSAGLVNALSLELGSKLDTCHIQKQKTKKYHLYFLGDIGIHALCCRAFVECFVAHLLELSCNLLDVLVVLLVFSQQQSMCLLRNLLIFLFCCQYMLDGKSRSNGCKHTSLTTRIAIRLQLLQTNGITPVPQLFKNSQ